MVLTWLCTNELNTLTCTSKNPRCKRGGRQPYLRQRASLNLPLWSVKPCSAIGRVDSQLEAPFSDDTSIALFSMLGSVDLRSAAAVSSCCLWRMWVFLLGFACFAFASGG